MIRTQLYLPEKEHADLIKTAHASNQSMAELVRGFIKTGLAKQRTADTSGLKSMQRLAQLNIQGGSSDLSTNLDHYLYSRPKKKSL